MKEGQRGRCFCQPCPSLCPSCADVPSSSSKWSLTFVACSVQRARCIIKHRNLTKAKRSRSILISICIEIINYNKYIYIVYYAAIYFYEAIHIICTAMYCVEIPNCARTFLTRYRSNCVKLCINQWKQIHCPAKVFCYGPGGLPFSAVLSWQIDTNS